MKKVIILILVMSCFSFQNNPVNLVGKWECYHREKEDGTTKSVDAFSGEEFEYSCNGLILDLKADFSGYESMNDLNFKYALKDSVLSLGNRYYIVELLNKNELILKDYDPKGISLNRFRNKYKRIE